ncbi:MAG: universal stress protein [Kouleothrix sp.]|jgi:nucleotide-binding universal stress UspA family protein|nr:universal stress protein [Kouleothrix sp.]
MNTILVPLDGSALAEQILPSVRVIAPLMSAEVHLLHVVTEADRYQLLFDDPRGIGEFDAPIAMHVAPANTGGAVVVEPVQARTSWDALQLNASNYLADQAEKLQAAGITTNFEVAAGNTAEVIAETAVRLGANLIAMATHGYSGLRRWALGSIADKVLHITHTPMLLVRGSERMISPERAIRRILLPLDGSSCARQAIPLATELACETQAELLVLTIIAPPYLQTPEVIGSYMQYDEAIDSVRDRLTDELAEYSATLKEHKVQVTPVATSGIPAETIIDEALDRGADLIVMATHGASGLRRWALGSVADKVLHATTTPLLLVRAQA